MEYNLRLLQMQVESENSIEKTRDLLTEAVTFFSSQYGNAHKLNLIFSAFRDNFKIDKLEEKEIFLYDMDAFRGLDIPSKFKSYSLGLFNDEHSCRYAGRVVYPVRDVTGKVMGLCGWDGVDLPKYLDSKTYGYNAKNNCMYGMEKLPDYYKSNKPVIIVEGIACCNYLRSEGLQSLAILGSYLSKYVIEILKRFGPNCIMFPDNDEAGLSVLRSSKYNLPTARCYVSLIAKDIDDTRRFDGGKYEAQLLEELQMLANPFYNNKIIRLERVLKKGGSHGKTNNFI